MKIYIICVLKTLSLKNYYNKRMSSSYTTKYCCALLKVHDKHGKRMKCYYKAKGNSKYCGIHKNYDASIPPPPPPEIQDIPNNTECAICLEEIKMNFVLTKCNHYFHTKCLDPWKAKSDSCPCCRNSMTTGEKITNLMTTQHVNMDRFSEIQNEMRSIYNEAFDDILLNMNTLNFSSNESRHEQAIQLRDSNVDRPVLYVFYNLFANQSAFPMRLQ